MVVASRLIREAQRGFLLEVGLAGLADVQLTGTLCRCLGRARLPVTIRGIPAEELKDCWRPFSLTAAGVCKCSMSPGICEWPEMRQC
jgi:hypothetical protein